VYRASQGPKDGWYELLARAVNERKTDREALLAMVSAMQQASYPGFVGNADAFPDVLEPENVALVTNALASEARLLAH